MDGTPSVSGLNLAGGPKLAPGVLSNKLEGATWGSGARPAPDPAALGEGAWLSPNLATQREEGTACTQGLGSGNLEVGKSGHINCHCSPAT